MSCHQAFICSAPGSLPADYQVFPESKKVAETQVANNPWVHQFE
jgi:hypothetical protein